MPDLTLPPDSRAVYDFDIPESAREWPEDPQHFALVPLRVSEALDGLKAAEASGNPMSVYEMVKRATKELNHKPMDAASPQFDWIDRCSPKVRMLVQDAFNSIAVPSDDERKAFLASRKRRA